MGKIKQPPFSSPTKKRGRYVNKYVSDLKRSPFHFLLWRFGYYKDPFDHNLVPKDFSYPGPSIECDKQKSCVTWIGHSSFLIQSSVNILTDPVFYPCCSPFSICGPKRKHDLPLLIEDLPRIDYVLISHNHYDHLDASCVMALANKFPECVFVVPLGVKKWFFKRKVENVVELSWGDSSQFSEEIKITSVPTQHFSGRGLFDSNKTLWSGYVAEIKKDKKKVYFAGDTGYNPFDFKAIGEVWKGFDLSLIPIGCYCPREFMKAVHVNPWEAVCIHEDVFSKKSIGMHWKSFCLAEEKMDRPAYELYLAMKEKKLDTKSFFVIDPGNYINY